MEKFTFHRDELVPEGIKTKELLEEWNEKKSDVKYIPGDKVRNVNNLSIVMNVYGFERLNGKLLGIKCYWWE